jgi:hypothetical protein
MNIQPGASEVEHRNGQNRKKPFEGADEVSGEL